MRVYYMIKKLIRGFKSRLQRFARGYADSDVWNFDCWFMDIIPKMLEHLSKNHVGFPVSDGARGTMMVVSTEEDVDGRSKRWEETLERMAFLARETGEDTCSMKNPYGNQIDFYYELFDRKWKHKDKLLKDGEDKLTHVGPERDPEFGEDFMVLRERYINYENKIYEYRNKCKDEFFVLLSRYFWDLWD